MPKLEEVFKLQGVPDYTFVPPKDYLGLKVSLRTPGRGIVIEGPSGIGKTCAVRTALRELAQAGELPYKEPLELSARRPDDLPFIAALHEMKALGLVVVDDFHRLPLEIRESLANLLKTLADSEDSATKLVLVGINKAGDSLVQLAADLNNRIDIIRFEANPPEFITKVFSLGEAALNVTFPDVHELVNSSYGSFYLAQMLAYHSCVDSGVIETQEARTAISAPLSEVRGRLFENLDRIFYSPTRDFCRGMKPRPQGNAPYMRLLYWLAQAPEWWVSVSERLNQEPAYRGSIGQIADKKYVKTLIDQKEDIARVLSWDDESQVLAVEDPQYVFYLKSILWNKFPRRIGYRSVFFPPASGKPYDIALSFAGADRVVARAIFDDLTERGYEVFYDEHEGERILAESVEAYLAPIYSTESKYVVALLGPEYPKRVWTRFESEQFGKRFGENAVIPVWFATAPPTMFDTSRAVGGFEYDPAKELQPQVQAFCGLVDRKLEAVAILDPVPDQIAEELEP